jgi:hypothetical protein
MKSTQAMRDRARELMSKERDDYDRAFECVLDDLEGLLRVAPTAPDHGGKAVIEGDAVVIRFPIDAMQSALDGAWCLNVFDRRQKVTDPADFAKEFCMYLNAESENGTTPIHRMADKAFINMMDCGAFGFDEHEEQSL